MNLNNNLIVQFDSYSIDLTLYSFYYLNDNKFSNEYIANTIGLPLSISITNRANKLKLTLYSYNYNFYIINSYLKFDQLNYLNVSTINENHELFHDLIDYKYHVLKYKNNVNSSFNPNYIYVVNGPTGGRKDTPSSLSNAFKERDLSDEKMESILFNLTTGISKNIIRCSNIVEFIYIESFFQGVKFFLINDEYGVFIDSVKINQYKYMNVVFIFDVVRVNDKIKNEQTYFVKPLMGLEITAVQRNGNNKLWNDEGYDPSLNKIAYITNSSTVYGISDITLDSKITDGVITSLSENYNASIYNKNDITLFAKMYVRWIAFFTRPNIHKMITNIMKTSVDVSKLQWKVFHDVVTNQLSSFTMNEVCDSIRSAFKDRKMEIENNELLSLFMHFSSNDYYSNVIIYNKESNNTKLDTKLTISLKQSYQNVNWNYSDEVFSCIYTI